jgi:hypothetical protein
VYFFDAHGNQHIWDGNPSSTSNIRSTIGGEIYGNVFKRSQYRVFNLRGGSWLIFSNRWDNSATINLTEEEGWQTQFFNPLDTSWPAQEQITNTFIWNNTNSSGLVTGVSLPQASDSTFIQKNRDYWMNAPQSGQAYFPYTPLVYPHPLVSGTAAPPGTPPTPAISISPSSQDFGTVAIGATNDMTITVQNVGGGTLEGAANVSAPFSIVNGSTYSLGSGASRPITIRFAPTSVGTSTKTVTFSNVEIANVYATVSGSGVGAQASLSFDSTAGTVIAPFTINPDNTISQSVEATDPTLGGRAEYVFTIPATTNYVVSMMVYAPTESANSIFVSIDGEPTSPDSIWDIPTNTALKSGVVASRTTGNNKEWMLTKGTHRLIICGREAGVKIGAIWVNPAVPAEIIPDSIKLGP